MDKPSYHAQNFDYYTLKNAHSKYYELIGMEDVPNSRKRHLMLARHAFCCAFRPYTTLQTLGQLVGKDHATILYYIRTHEAQTMYGDYRQLYKVAEELCKTYLTNEYDTLMSYYDLMEETEKLRSEVRELLIYKANYIRLKELVDGVQV